MLKSCRTPRMSKKIIKRKRGTQTDSQMALPCDPVAFIAPGVECKGVMTSDGQMRIDGSLEGEIHSKGTVVVGEKAMVSAKIQAESVISEGQITGTVKAKKNIHLRSSAVVKGSVNTPYLSMEEGALLETDWSLWIHGERIPGRVWSHNFQRGAISSPTWGKASTKPVPRKP